MKRLSVNTPLQHLPEVARPVLGRDCKLCMALFLELDLVGIFVVMLACAVSDCGFLIFTVIQGITHVLMNLPSLHFWH